MLSRESLWRRLSGASLWPLPWALAAACALPWMLPEAWHGEIPTLLRFGGWAAVLLSAPLLRFRRLAGIPFGILLLWGTLGHLARASRAEAARPTGWTLVEGRVSSPWSRRGTQIQGSLRVDAPQSLAGTELPLSLPADSTPPPPPGTPVRFRAELLAVEPAPAFLAERPLWRARDGGTPRRAHLPSALVMEALGPPAPSLRLRFQAWARARFDALPLDEGPARDLWGALTLGLPPVHDDVVSVFAESGTLHTLVVSGLQVTLVMAAIEALLRRLLGRGGALGALVAGLLYAALVGFSAPVWRGLAMGAGWVAGRTSGWNLPPLLTLHGALLAWLMGHPAAGTDPGFLLAWWALLALFWGADPLAGLLFPLLGRTARPLARVLAPWLSTVPLLALFHGGAPLWGAAANLLLVPLVALLTPLCLGLTLLPLPGAGLVGKLLAWTATGLLPPFQAIRPLATGVLWPWILLLLGWLLLAQAWSRFRPCRALALGLVAGSLGLLAARGTGSAPRALSLEAIDVGQGDALLLRVPGGDATLVDTGPNPWAARRIARVLSRRGVREPMHLCLTHPHGDHAGGWSTLSRLWPPASTVLPVLADEAAAWGPYGPAVSGSEALRRGEGWRRGEAEFSVRWPPKAYRLPDANMVSLVLRVTWQDRELWLMGDALDIQERDLLDLGDPPASPRHRLLKAGHHGSRSSSDPAWVGALHPEVALLTAGRRNRFGHPHAETLATLAGVGLSRIVGPDHGTRIEVQPGGWVLACGNGQTDFTPLRRTPTLSAPR